MHSHRLNKAVLAALAGIAMAGLVGRTAQAANDQTLNVFDSVDNDFISGNATAIDHFVQVNATQTVGTGIISVAIKPRDRDTSQANFITDGNHYVVDSGHSQARSDRPNLAFSYQFDPGTDATTNYVLKLSVDFDPAVGAADFYTQTLPIFGTAPTSTVDGWNETDGYYLNGQTGNNPGTTPHAWNQADVPYVISNSGALSFYPAPNGRTYNQDAAGEYELRLEVFSANGQTLLGSATAFANVVPEPTSIAAMGLGIGGMLMRRRRSL